MNRRVFLKSLVAVPALVRSFARPAWQVALARPMPGMFANADKIATMYRTGEMAHVQGFDWFDLHERYVVPATRHIVTEHMATIDRIYRSENWCGTFDLLQVDASC